jgi:hypothetical protein
MPLGGGPDVIMGGGGVELGASVTDSAEARAEKSPQTNANGRLRNLFMLEPLPSNARKRAWDVTSRHREVA